MLSSMLTESSQLYSELGGRKGKLFFSIEYFCDSNRHL